MDRGRGLLGFLLLVELIVWGRLMRCGTSYSFFGGGTLIFGVPGMGNLGRADGFLVSWGGEPLFDFVGS